MEWMKFKKLDPLAIIPQYQTEGAAGFDFHSMDNVVIYPDRIVVVSTGLAVELPHLHELQIRPRSGLVANKGITVANSPGTIDEDYRGEIKIIMTNLSDKPSAIKKGDRIAQGVVAKVAKPIIQVVEELSNTSRGDGGLGHTGE